MNMNSLWFQFQWALQQGLSSIGDSLRDNPLLWTGLLAVSIIIWQVMSPTVKNR